MHKKKFYSLKKTDDPATLSAEAAIAIIHEKRSGEANRIIREYHEKPEVKVLNGRYGPYISIGKDNYKIPKGKDPASLTLDDCLTIAKSTPATTRKRGIMKKGGK